MPYLFPDGAQFGADHVLLHASSRRHRVDSFAGPLSIKTVVSGEVAWTVRGRGLLLDPHTFLVLGAGEPYSMNINAPKPVETACVFFRDGFVEAVARDAAGAVLDRDDPAPPLPWLSRLNEDAQLIENVQTLVKRCSAGLMPSGFEEELLLLARDLLALYEETAHRVGSVPATKASTREELFRRMEMGREYMHGCADSPVSLEAVARVACLSPFHFHRTFVHVWGQTPHHYLTKLRLDRARSALLGGMTVADVSERVGFASVSSFSRLFLARYGVSPGKIRKNGHSAMATAGVSSGS